MSGKVQIRELVYAAMEEFPPPELSEHLVATYFVAARSMAPASRGRNSLPHDKWRAHSSAGSLLAACSGEVVDAIAFDAAERVGVVRVAFPLKMLLSQRDDLLDGCAAHRRGGRHFWLTENVDIKLVDLAMSPETLRRFPGPAYAAPGIRRLVHLANDEVALGTILKPCTGITPLGAGGSDCRGSGCKSAVHIYQGGREFPAPRPLCTARAACAACHGGGTAGGCPAGRPRAHLRSACHLLSEPPGGSRHAARSTKCATGSMFSQYYIGGAVDRIIRDVTAALPHPPVIYGHNGGIDF